tara:strand:- start:1852 stop:2736 length:885 start_codon:yes stop_codon:yes gene_type:complete
MALDMVAVLRRLGVSIDSQSPPLTQPGVVSWLGRLYDVTPEHSNLGMKEGMEVWSSGQGFAPLDLAGIESWLFDAPRGNHLIIAERRITFDIQQAPSRDGRNLVIWTLNDLAAFIGHAVIDGRLQILEEEVVNDEDLEPELFSGDGPFTLKPNNDFSPLESKGLDVSLAKPVLVPAKLHKVTGLLKGPGEDEVCRWVLNSGGLHVLHEFELLDRSPMLNHEKLDIEPVPDFTDLLSERRSHSEGMGDLLHWWTFDSESANVETYDVLVPAHKGIDAMGSTWILDGVSNKLHLNC